MVKQKFKCEFCHKETESENFPYEQGWKYVYSFQFKNDKNVEQRISDKRFCSSQCMFFFIRDLFVDEDNNDLQRKSKLEKRKNKKNG